MLYAYGVAEAGRPVMPFSVDGTAPGLSEASVGGARNHDADLFGLDGAAVELLTCGQLAVAVSRHAEGDLKPTTRRLQEHSAINLALVRSGGVAPFRFGNTFADADELRRKLEPRADALREKLAALTGCAELTVRMKADQALVATADPHPNPLPEGEGTRYLLGKRRRMRGEDLLRDQAAALRTELGPTVRDFREDLRDDVLRLALLVPLEDVAELVAKFGMSGPWPPSSFV
jgi:hypothetical protein